MSGLNVFSVQEIISAYIQQEFSNYVVYDDVVLDDEFVIKIGNKVKPYIVLRWGGLRPSPTGASFMGPRNDEYYSTVDISVVAPTPNQSRRALNIIVDKMVGYKPTGGSPMSVEGGMDTIGIPDYDGRPHVYLSSTRFRYAINGENVGAYITP